MTAVPVSIIPRPLSVTTGQHGVSGAVLSDGLLIAHAPALVAEARWFRQVLEAATGWVVNLAATERPGAATIELRLGEFEVLPNGLDALIPAATRRDAYRLSSNRGRVAITSPSGAGAFYGLQTLRQLLPDSVFRRAGRSGAIPVLEAEILDAPRFSWRGVHLDVCRHFMPKSFILKLIDLIALHKCNVLHLHLTDDQGWRIPIERYPLLTEIGAWRRESSVGGEGEGLFDGIPHGGFYTREDLEEIVGFAAERHVNVLPEIDMPGHMAAAIAAYPELGNTGRRLQVRTTWGVSNHILNLEEKTVRFCTDVIDEVADIFPWTCFHVGGDECPTVEWATSPRAKQIMHEQGFTELRQLQGWFTARMAEHLARRGRTLVGWAEILEGGAPEGSIAMSWRGEDDAVKAARAGHRVVMAAQDWLYFDRPYSSDPAEPKGSPGATDVEKVYMYEPVSAALQPEQRHQVLGAQCQLWTEYVTTPVRAEYLYFPRLSAFAEIVWSTETAGQPKSYEEFEQRLARHLDRLAAIGVNYRPLDGPTPGQASVWSESGGAVSE
ncbi:MAG: beta-N-acetylhexosaminidase [Acidimicrobiales bacterium]|jgi:hexosaminidase